MAARPSYCHNSVLAHTFCTQVLLDDPQTYMYMYTHVHVHYYVYIILYAHMYMYVLYTVQYMYVHVQYIQMYRSTAEHTLHVQSCTCIMLEVAMQQGCMRVALDIPISTEISYTSNTIAAAPMQHCNYMYTRKYMNFRHSSALCTE